MKKEAIAATEIRLQRVRQAISEFRRDGRTNSSVQTAWWSFLLSVSGFYAKLEQGAKGHGKSEAWFGRKKHERKNDDLLSYLHHARNSEEHGLQGSTKEHGILATAGNKWTKIIRDGSDGSGIEVIAPSHDKVSVQLINPGFFLVPVHDRCVNIFKPPICHLGAGLAENTVLGAMEAAESYLSTMLSEALALDPHT